MFDINITDLRLLKIIYKEEKIIIDKLTRLVVGVEFNQEIKVTMFEEKKRMERYIGQKLPSWIKGVALDSNEVLILCKDIEKEIEDIRKVILHECVHVILKKYRLPNWINEGCAVYFSGQYCDMSFCDGEIENPYNLDYMHENYYYIVSHVIKKLCDLYGEESIINHLRWGGDYENDYVFGKSVIGHILEMEKEK